MELYQKSAYELSTLLREGKCTSAEILDSLFARIDAVEDRVGAYITIIRDEAYAKAQEMDARRAAGEELHSLAGVPIAIKDNICTKDVLTTCASKMLYNFKPPYSATVIEKLEACGVIIVGKTNMDEFAMGSTTESSYFHLTKNPRNLEYAPGGSSGGSAAAVAAGEAPIALGTDTGGSIRQPSSLCGVVGLKPTYGSVSRYGAVAFGSSLDQIGPIGRTVKDVTMVYEAIRGRDPRDATSSTVEHPDCMASLDQDIKGLRIGIPAEYYGEGIDKDVKNAVMAAVEALKAKGAVVKDISLPSTAYALPAYYIISSAEASSNLARFDGVKYGYRAKEYSGLTDMYERTRSEGFGDEVKRRIMLGTFVLSSGYYDAYYKRAKLLQRRVGEEFASAFAECDVMITPTYPSAGQKLGENADDPVKMYAGDVCTINVNIAGLPAMSIPCGKGDNGLPVGLQIIGPKFSEHVILRLANHYEEIYGGFNNVAAL